MERLLGIGGCGEGHGVVWGRGRGLRGGKDRREGQMRAEDQSGMRNEKNAAFVLGNVNPPFGPSAARHRSCTCMIPFDTWHGLCGGKGGNSFDAP